MKKTLQHGFFIIRIFFDLDLDDTCSDLFRFYCGTIDFWDFCKSDRIDPRGETVGYGSNSSAKY